MNDRDLKTIPKLYVYCFEILCFIKGMDFKTFMDKSVVNKACVLNIEQIGETAKDLSNEFREEHDNIDWRKMIGMRNKISHSYTGINYEIVWKTIREDILELFKFTDKLMKEYVKETDVLTVEYIIKKLVPVFEAEGVTKATLIGDYADGTADDQSHVVILVEVKPSVRGLAFYGIAGRADEAIGKFVSLVTQDVVDRNTDLKVSQELNGILFYERKED
jgi:uncharacterized protein with HEPN domain